MAEKTEFNRRAKKQILAIKKQSRSQKQAITEKMIGLKTEMRALVTSEKMDEEKLNDLVNQKKELVGEKLKIKLETKNQIYNHSQ